MDTPSPLMRDLARRLLAASQSAAGSHAQEAELVSEKLRISLTRFAGPDGFVALLRRAVALASAEVPTLKNATVSEEGRLEGLEQFPPQSRSATGAAAVAITAHMLGLLETFIGEGLTVRLVLEAPSDTPLDEEHS